MRQIGKRSFAENTLSSGGAVTNAKVRWEFSDAAHPPFIKELLLSEGEVIKQSPAKLVTYHKTEKGSFYVKRSRHASFTFRPQKYWFKDCPSRWEWRVAHTAKLLGIPIVDHLAICEIWSLTGLNEDILITRAFDGKPLHVAENVDVNRVMEFVKRCHDKGMIHGDLHPANILINSSGELRFVDLKGVRFEKKPDRVKQSEDIAYLNIHFPMPLPPELLRISDKVRRKKMAIRYRRCLKNNREFGLKSYGRSKWWVRKTLMNDQLNQLLKKPDLFLTGESLLKNGRSCTVGQHDVWVIKRYNFKKPLNLVKDLFRSTKAKRAFQLGYHLELVGVATPRVIAMTEHRTFGLALRSYLVMEKIVEATDLSDNNCYSRDFIRCLAKLIGRMHAEGFVHRDLKASNVLVDLSGKPYLIDLDGLSFMGQVSPCLAVSNLKRLERGLVGKTIFTRLNWMSFLRTYCSMTGFCLSELRMSTKKFYTW